MTTLPLSPVAGLRLTSRAALGTALVFSALFIAMFSLLLPLSDVPEGQQELIAASRNPQLWRLSSVLDVGVWLGTAVILLGLAVAAFAAAPLRALLIGLAAAAQPLGAMGGMLRLSAVTELGSRYGTDQESVVAAYRTVNEVINTHFDLGSLLYAVGFLLAAWVGLRYRLLPRWLAIFIAVFAMFGLVTNALDFAGIGSPLPVSLLFLFTGIVLQYSMAAGLWRWQPAM
ncbi:MAG: hypothetical protein ACRDG7_13265 [Candidatus Limnocylindria bacterium]